METPGAKLRPCPRCGALNGAGFDRCIRCAAPLGALASGADALGAAARASIDPQKLWGTKILIALTGIVFAAQLASMLQAGQGIGLFSGGSRADLLRFGGMYISLDAARAEPFRLLSAVFVHFGVLHFVMNMMGLASTGRVAEPGVGTARFVVAYLASGVLGFATNLAVEAVFPHRGVTPVFTAGASGAVFGSMGLTLGWLLRMRDRRWRRLAMEIAFYALVVNLVVRVNNGAHVGGILAGAAFGFYYASRPRPRSLLLANAGALLGLALSIASLLLAQRSARSTPLPSWSSVPSRPSPAPTLTRPSPEDV